MLPKSRWGVSERVCWRQSELCLVDLANPDRNQSEQLKPQTTSLMQKINLFSLGIALLFCAGTPLHAQLSDITQPGDPIVATSNNSPGSEGVANAIDNQ